jgi:CNT family concentrative nucleoside transporter
MQERLISVLGVLAMPAIAFLLCPNALKRKVRWKSVGVGMAVLIGFSVLVLRTPFSRVFVTANDVVERLLDFSLEGAKFVFGSLVTNKETFGYIFAFQACPTIIFFASLMAILYYLRVMPFIIRMMARFISRFMGVSGAESFSTVSDIFVGQTEAPLVIRPYVASMTNSELMACMTAGFATTAGGVLAAYVLMLRDFVPGIAGHLIACSVMCAPASIVIAKLMLPETGNPVTMGNTGIEIPQTDANIVDAAARGTTDGLYLAFNVAAMLISFLALTAVLNFGLVKLGTSLEEIFGWIFMPVAWLLGTPAQDLHKIGTLLGQKMVLNEFVAYSHMADKLRETQGEWLTERGRLVASYALCGFANFGSIGIQIGGYSSLAPERRGDLSRVAFRAMIGGTLATCLAAAVAGVLT